MKLIRSPLELARWLLAAEMVALLFSPPLTNLVELALYLLMLASGELRARFVRAVRQPMVLAALLFLAVVTVGLAYSIGSWDDSFGMWWGGASCCCCRSPRRCSTTLPGNVASA